MKMASKMLLETPSDEDEVASVFAKDINIVISNIEEMISRKLKIRIFSEK